MKIDENPYIIVINNSMDTALTEAITSRDPTNTDFGEKALIRNQPGEQIVDENENSMATTIIISISLVSVFVVLLMMFVIK